MNAAITRSIRADVAQRLADRQHVDDDAGRSMLSEADQHAFVHQLIADALDIHARSSLADGRKVLAQEEEEEITRGITDSLFGLGGLQRYLDDPDIENINVNGADVVWVRYADGTPKQVAPVACSDGELIHLLRTAAARMGVSERRFDLGSPRLNLNLPDGSRLFAVMSVSARPAVSIRRHRYLKVTLDDLVEMGTMDSCLREFLGAAVRARKSMVIAGGTSVGKTTMLRALAAAISADERLVTIEDSLELGLERYPELHPDVVALEAREANVEGEGEVSVAELVRWALRMSPDRVIVGEVRGDEVIPMLNAMSLGNDGSLCTIHANSSRAVFGKLATYAIQAAERLPLDATNLLIANAIDFVVFLARTRDGHRVVASVREVVDAEGPLVVSNEIFRPGRDQRAVPSAPLRQDTLEQLVAAGFDPEVMHDQMRWSA